MARILRPSWTRLPITPTTRTTTRMHGTYPSRKDSNPPRYASASASSSSPSSSSGRGLLRYIPPIVRRARLRGGLLAALILGSVLYVVYSLGGGAGPRAGRSKREVNARVPSGDPPAVIVTVLDEVRYNKGYLELVKENRALYAQRHGYHTFFPSVVDYDLDGAPTSWTKVVAMRHALTEYPDATYFWFLDQDSFIMSPERTVEGSLMKAGALEEVMIKDHPVVPPDSIIRTFTHLKGQDVDLVMTQDKEGLSVGSFLLRNGEWARFFTETWFDPVYRSYNFQKAEAHALEHIVQWHPTILSKLALVPQRYINAYSTAEMGEAYEAGDIAVRFPTCGNDGPSECESEANKFTQLWRSAFKNS